MLRSACLSVALLSAGWVTPFLSAQVDLPDYKTLNTAGTPESDAYWASWIEPDFPFFSSVLEVPEASGDKRRNLTPRSLVLNLGSGYWVAFDIDLLRVSAVWKGQGVTPAAMAPGTYRKYGWKTKGGDKDSPKPDGTLLLYSPLHPGWEPATSEQTTPKKVDPRERGFASEKEVGLGALSYASFLGVKRNNAGQVELHYQVQGTKVVETWSLQGVQGQPGVTLQRKLQLSDHQAPLWLLAPQLKADTGIAVAAAKLEGKTLSELDDLRLDTSPQAQTLTFTYVDPNGRFQGSVAWKESLWKDQTLSGETHLSAEATTKSYVKDDLKLPYHNPWKRHVRIGDVTFLNDKGLGAVVTYDGDVWLVSGLIGDLNNVTWNRFASGLHEPMSIVARQDEHSKDGLKTLYVYDKNGIWRLIDQDGNGEVDDYQMFSHRFGQSAEARDFASSMKLAPDQSFVISKGGQQESQEGKHNGTVLRISPDGQKVELLGYGFRQPFIGVHPLSGIVTASDQEGHYVPTTPLALVEKGQFYGHLPSVAPKEQYPAPIVPPVLWIPHTVNASALTQTWLVNSSLGPIEGDMIHVGYNRPEIFRVLWNTRGSKPQAAIMSFDRNFTFAPFNATINPADGTLYLAGFQSWGTIATEVSGFQRLRYTKQPRLFLKQLTGMKQGVLLEFTHALDEKIATDPESYSIERWNYKRTPNYGSPHLKLDGAVGQDWMHASAVYLSEDRTKAFVAIPEMKAGIDQMRIGWAIKSQEGLPGENTAYFTPHELLDFIPSAEGFKGDLKVNLTPREIKLTQTELPKPTIEEGYKVSQMMGCMACHSIDGSQVGKVGPSWKGLYGVERRFANSKEVLTVDDAYLIESIVEPSAKVVKGFEKFDSGMPIYAGVLNESQIQSLILYIKSLK